jgi:hypothetical protein
LISVDELRAAGALDVPAAWRKSLCAGRLELHLFSGFVDDDDTLAEKQQPTPGNPDDNPGDPGGNESADEPP